MSNLGLHSGHVPVERIRSFIDERLSLGGHFSSEHPSLACLTRMWGQNDRFWKTLNGTGDAGGQEWMEFGVADQALCLLGLQMSWRDELADIYLAVRLDRGSSARVVPQGMHRCERQGCSNIFEQHVSGSKKRYCSVICKNQAYKLRVGITKTVVTGPGRRLASLRCKHGHERTPENTYLYRGKRLCMVCRNERKREAYERNAEAERERSRQRRLARLAA